MWNAGLTHCITSPLLLPITLVYFCGKHVVDKYCLLYVRPHTLKNSGAFANTLESFIVIALLLYQLHMTLFVLSRVDLGSEVVTASSLALLFIMAGLLILSFVFYMGILQRALCPYSDGWRLSASRVPGVCAPCWALARLACPDVRGMRLWNRRQWCSDR